MGIKKRNKVSAEFSMSSLTDIIFLLLIFFMLTSSMIVPNALNLKLPGKSNYVPPAPKEKPNIVKIAPKGTYYYNGGKVTRSDLDKKIRDLRKTSKKPSFVIAPDKNTPNEYVVAVMDMAYRYGVAGILTDVK